MTTDLIIIKVTVSLAVCFPQALWQALQAIWDLDDD